MFIKLSYDPAKRQTTLEKRGLDFEHAVEVFSKLHYNFVDERFDYGEVRRVSVGYLGIRMVVIVWTHRGQCRHIISMRKANEKEQKKYQIYLG
jgi:uncharacterized DUF497 family protein